MIHLLGHLHSNFKNQLPALANALLASLSYVLSKSSSSFDLHISLPADGQKVIVVIPGAKKAELQGEIEEYLAKLFEFEIDSEVKEFLQKCTKKMDEIVTTACKNKVDMFESTYKLLATNRSLENLYQGMLGSEDIDESIFVRSSSVNDVLIFRSLRQSNLRLWPNMQSQITA